MPRESKLFPAHILGPQDTITLYECFGWELHSWNDKIVTMQRESKHPAYATLVANQAEFDRLFDQYLHLKAPVLAPPPTGIETKQLILRLLCFVVPGVLYYLRKKKERELYDAEVVPAYEKAYAEYEGLKKKLLEETQHISEESRRLFFES